MRWVEVTQGASVLVGEPVALQGRREEVIVITSEGEIGVLDDKSAEMARRCLQRSFILTGSVTSIDGSSSAKIKFSGSL